MGTIRTISVENAPTPPWGRTSTTSGSKPGTVSAACSASAARSAVIATAVVRIARNAGPERGAT